MHTLSKLTAALFTSLLIVGLAACEQEGPAEKAGKKIDNIIEKAGDKVEDTADKLEKKTDK